LAGAVTDHRQRGEGELAAALDGLADTVDRDQLFDHAVVDLVAVATPPRITFVSHLLSFLELSDVAAWPLMVVSTAGVSRTGKNPGRARRETAPAAGTKSLELQATLAGGVGQGLDAAVVAVTGTVERDLLDTGGLGLLGDRLADLGGGVGVLAVL